jgi:hypothetical protein
MRVKPMKKDVLSGSAKMGGRRRFWPVAVAAGLAVAGLVVVGPARADFAQITKMFGEFGTAWQDFQTGVTGANQGSMTEATANIGSAFDLSTAFSPDGKLNFDKLMAAVRQEQPGEVNPDATATSVAAKVAANQVLSTEAQEARRKQQEYLKSLVTQTSGFSQEAAQASADGQGLQSSQDVLKKILEQNAALAKINQASIQMGAQTAKGIDENTVQLGTLNQSMGAIVDDNRAKEQERRMENMATVYRISQTGQNLRGIIGGEME